MGLHELAGQTSAIAPVLAKEFRSLDVVFQEHHPFHYDENKAVVLDPQSPWQRVVFILRQILSHDFFIFEGSPFTFHLYEVPLLRLLHRKFVIRFHGCDVRYREGGLARGLTVCQTCDQVCETWKPRRTARLVQAAAACIVTTPDLVDFVPGSVFIPQAVSIPADWGIRHTGQSVQRRYRIVHAPSIRSRKGTDVVLSTLNHLKERFPIDVVLLENVPNSTVLRELDCADLVVDQLRVGWYGVLACEAMARGVPVVATLRQEWVAEYQPRCPIVSADDVCLEQVIESLLADPLRMQQLSAESRAFAETVHSPEAVTAKVLDVCRRAV